MFSTNTGRWLREVHVSLFVPLAVQNPEKCPDFDYVGNLDS